MTGGADEGRSADEDGGAALVAGEAGAQRDLRVRHLIHAVAAELSYRLGHVVQPVDVALRQQPEAMSPLGSGAATVSAGEGGRNGWRVLGLSH